MTQEEKDAILKIDWHSKTFFVLDKNFHVYAHGPKEKVDVDEDENGKYLKLYFDKIK